MKDKLFIENGFKIPYDLRPNGFNDNVKTDISEFDLELIEDIRKVIRLHFFKESEIVQKTYANSYSIKSKIEIYLGKYCSNGDLIIAMINEGFKFEREKDSLNCFFNLTQESYDYLFDESKNAQYKPNHTLKNENYK